MRRPQMSQPPCMNTNCRCDCGGTIRPMQPMNPVNSMPAMPGMPVQRAVMPVRESRMPEQEDRMQMNDSRMPGLECKMSRQQDRMTLSEFPIGMGYVPWQRWCQTYPMEQALIRGTIFPELDYPFVMGRCRG